MKAEGIPLGKTMNFVPLTLLEDLLFLSSHPSPHDSLKSCTYRNTQEALSWGREEEKE